MTVRTGPAHALRVGAFRALEALSHARIPPGPVTVVSDVKIRDAEPHLWVYATTIGELNAVEPLIRRIQQEMGLPPLLLLSNHPHYADAYLAKFPGAVFVAFDGATPSAVSIVTRLPPRMLLIAEIPCLLHDAPCRLSYATVRAVAATGAPVVLSNGWLYGDAPASRMDRLESRLFMRDFVKTLDVALVQTPEVRDALLRQGARADTVVVTGNLKYDVLAQRHEATPLSPLARALKAGRSGPLVVAGSVTEPEEQRQLLRAFAALRRAHPGATLVLAPRHPENKSRMQALKVLLQESGETFALRTEVELDDIGKANVLVLDTIGELRGCYAIATFTVVGCDHNVLEPLSFGRLVYTYGDWSTKYPSHRVFADTLAAELIRWEESLNLLGQLWLDHMTSLAEVERHQIEGLERFLSHGRGVLEESLAAMRSSGLFD